MLTKLLTVVRQQALGALALFVALGGTSYAVATGSIDSREIKNNTVKSKDIKNGTVVSRDVKRNSLGGAGIDESRLGRVPNAARADRATTAGSASRSATADEAGTIRGVRFVQAQAAPVNSGIPANITATCPGDHKAIGGGAGWIIPNFGDNNQFTALEAPITATAPVPATADIDDATGWQAFGRNLSGASRALRVYAVCIRK